MHRSSYINGRDIIQVFHQKEENSKSAHDHVFGTVRVSYLEVVENDNPEVILAPIYYINPFNLLTTEADYVDFF